LRVWDLENRFGALGLGSRVSGVGSKVWGLGLGFLGLGFRVLFTLLGWGFGV
jgi:hypothetical protein